MSSQRSRERKASGKKLHKAEGIGFVSLYPRVVGPVGKKLSKGAAGFLCRFPDGKGITKADHFLLGHLPDGFHPLF